VLHPLEEVLESLDESVGSEDVDNSLRVRGGQPEEGGKRWRKTTNEVVNHPQIFIVVPRRQHPSLILIEQEQPPLRRVLFRQFVNTTERSRVRALDGFAKGGGVGVSLDLGGLAGDFDGGGLRRVGSEIQRKSPK
jgi:hypothetical protein